MKTSLAIENPQECRNCISSVKYHYKEDCYTNLKFSIHITVLTSYMFLKKPHANIVNQDVLKEGKDKDCQTKCKRATDSQIVLILHNGAVCR